MRKMRELLLERCNPEEEVVTVTTMAGAGRCRWWVASPWPTFFVGDGARVEKPLLLLDAAKVEANS